MLRRRVVLETALTVLLVVIFSISMIAYFSEVQKESTQKVTGYAHTIPNNPPTFNGTSLFSDFDDGSLWAGIRSGYLMPGKIGKINKSNGAILNEGPAGTSPNEYTLAVDDKYVYVASTLNAESSIFVYNKTNLNYLAALAVGSEPSHVAVDKDFIWGLSNNLDKIVKFNKTDFSKITEFTVPNLASALAVDDKFLWAGTSNGMTRINKTDLSQFNVAGVTPIFDDDVSNGIAIDKDFVWISSLGGRVVSRVNKSSLEVKNISMTSYTTIVAIQVDENFAWLANSSELRKVSRTNISNFTVIASAPVSVGGLVGVAVDDNFAWVINWTDISNSEILKINKTSHQTVASFSMPGAISRGDYTGYQYWQMFVKRGGKLSDQSILTGQSKIAFTLNDSFSDPDGDTLTFSKIQTGSSSTIQILPNGSVNITGISEGVDYVVFKATDDGGLSNFSNNVSITVVADSDGDGVLDGVDNCPTVSNAGQEDFDNDKIGDACDESVIGGSGGSGFVFPPTLCSFATQFVDLDEDGANDCNIDFCVVGTECDFASECFDPSNKDLDDDLVGDVCDDDMDNDGIANEVDKLEGSGSDIISDSTLTLQVNSSTNVALVFNESLDVNITANGNKVVEFVFNFTQAELYLGNVTVQKQSSGASRGSVTISGIPRAHGGKIVYVDRISGTNQICVKDVEGATVEEVSSGCTELNEVLLNCDGETNQGYSCMIFGSQYKVFNLNNSVVVEMPAAPSLEAPLGGEGGGGGGGIVLQKECEEWSECGNDCKQTRECYQTISGVRFKWGKYKDPIIETRDCPCPVKEVAEVPVEEAPLPAAEEIILPAEEEVPMVTEVTEEEAVNLVYFISGAILIVIVIVALIQISRMSAIKKDPIRAFFKGAHKLGKTKDEIKKLLRKGGWTERQIKYAFEKYLHNNNKIAGKKNKYKR